MRPSRPCRSTCAPRRRGFSAVENRSRAQASMRAAWFGQRGARVENRKSALYHRSHAPVSTVQEHVRAVINSVSMQITTTLPGFGSAGNPAAGPARRPRPADRCWDRQLGMSGGRCGRPIAHRSCESLTVPAGCTWHLGDIANSVFARSGGASRGLARTAGLAAGLKWSKMVYNGVCTLYKSIKLFPQQFGLEAWW